MFGRPPAHRLGPFFVWRAPLAATLREIVLMATSGKQRPEKQRALVSAAMAFEGERTPPKHQGKPSKPKDAKLALDIQRDYRFPE